MRCCQHTRSPACFPAWRASTGNLAAATLLLLTLGCGQNEGGAKAPTPGPLSDTGTGAPAGNERKPETPLPANVVAAWKAAGAEVGWAKYGMVDFHLDGEVLKGEIPTFRFDKWPEGRLAKLLPPPRRAFGLCLFSTTVTDTGLAQLAGMTRL